MSATAYVIAEGEYSDYHIVAVFSDPGKASAALEVIKRRGYRDDETHVDADIEEYDLDPEPSQFLRHPVLRLTMTKEGEVVSHQTYWPGAREERPDDVGFQYFIRPPRGREADPELVWAVATDDLDRAVKVVAEKRAEILAAGVWGDDDKARAYFSAKGGGE